MPTSVRRRTFLTGALAVATAAALFGVASTAQAATLFSDDFADGNTTGWTTSGGSWAATDGVLRQSGTTGDARALAGETGWTNYTVAATVTARTFNGAARPVSLLARAQSATSYYYLSLRNSNTLDLNKLVNGARTTLASTAFTVAAGRAYRLSLQVNGTSLTGRVDGGPTLTATDAQYSAGRVGLHTYQTAADFDNVTVDSVASPGPTTPSSSAPPPPGRDGFAGVNALGQNGTTGGAGGPTVTVSTTAEFLDYIARPGPYVIRVSGRITLPTGTTDGMHNVSSDKTIIGVGADAALVGGGLNIGLPVDDNVTSPPANAVHNIIIRNLSFSGATDDLLNVQMFSHHIWIDHNDFSNGDDGAVDIKRGSDFITVSWNRFHDHDKTALLGHDETAVNQDTGRLHVTYHHNFFDRSDQRHPRVRFAELVHVYNNYYYDNSYGIASTYNAGLFVEGNYFYSVNNPARVDFSGPLGRLVERDNILVDCNHAIETNGTVTDPRTWYAYTAHRAADVPTIVPAGAGVGKI